MNRRPSDQPWDLDLALAATAGAVLAAAIGAVVVVVAWVTGAFRR